VSPEKRDRLITSVLLWAVIFLVAWTVGTCGGWTS
jgi:hypothetical protein